MEARYGHFDVLGEHIDEWSFQLFFAVLLPNTETLLADEINYHIIVVCLQFS